MNAADEYDRDRLYAEVWAEPVRTVAERYGVSDVALANACRRLSVPLPGRGYWAKKRAGTAPEQPPLPKLSPEEEARLCWSSRYLGQPGRPMKAPQQDENSRDVPTIVVAERLKRPHALVANARELLAGPGSRHDFVSCEDKPCLNISVSRGSIRRALLIMDALLKGLEEQGYQIALVPPRRRVSYYGQPDLIPGKTRVKVGEEWIDFGLREGHSLVEKREPGDWGGYYRRRVRKPTGVFSLFVTNAPSGFRISWNDGKTQRVEDCLGPFIAYLPLIAAKLKEERLEAERRHQEWLVQERLRKEVEARRRAEERRRKDLSDALGRWRQAQDIRAFVADVREAAVAADGLDAFALEEKLVWALGHADALDPVPDFLRVPLAAVETQDDDE